MVVCVVCVFGVGDGVGESESSAEFGECCRVMLAVLMLLIANEELELGRVGAGGGAACVGGLLAFLILPCRKFCSLDWHRFEQ